MFVLDVRGSVRSDEVQRSEGGLSQVRRLSFYHFDGHDPQTPDIHFAAVFFASDHLGRHPVWGANHSGTLILGLIDLSAETKVGCL